MVSEFKVKEPVEEGIHDIIDEIKSEGHQVENATFLSQVILELWLDGINHENNDIGVIGHDKGQGYEEQKFSNASFAYAFCFLRFLSFSENFRQRFLELFH